MSGIREFEVNLKWKLEPHDRMSLREHVGTLTVGEGREWNISRSNLVLMLETDLPHPDSTERKCTYVLAPAPSIKTLASALLEAEK